MDQWSNGLNQADELDRLMKIRHAALAKLGEHTIRNGAPMATIEEPLVPIYMYHRYSVESTAHMVAGQDYIYAMRGDGRTPTRWVSAAEQRKALESLAATLKPSELTVPKQILDAIPPRPPGFGRHRELFPRTTGTTFDPLSPATVAADVTIGFVLQLDRASRMVAQHAEDPSLPGLEEVIDRLAKAVFDVPAATPYEQEVRRAEERVLVDRVMWLASGSPNAQVRAAASYKLQKLIGSRQAGHCRGRDCAAHIARCRYQALPSSVRPNRASRSTLPMRLPEHRSAIRGWTSSRRYRFAPGVPSIRTVGWNRPG
ncbi:MAG: zinc-dependent metalloprotease [Ignavibacteriota bacterium]